MNKILSLSFACLLISGCGVRSEYQEYSKAGIDYTHLFPPAITAYKEYSLHRAAIDIANELNEDQRVDYKYSGNPPDFGQSFCPPALSEKSRDEIKNDITGRKLVKPYDIFLKEYCLEKKFGNNLNEILTTNQLMGQYFDTLAELIDSKSPDFTASKIDSIIENLSKLSGNAPPEKKSGGVVGFIFNIALNNTVRNIITENSPIIEKTLQNQIRILDIMRTKIHNEYNSYGKYFMNKIITLDKNTVEYNDILYVMNNYQEKINSVENNLTNLKEISEKFSQLNKDISNDKGVSIDTILSYLTEISKLKKSF